MTDSSFSTAPGEKAIPLEASLPVTKLENDRAKYERAAAAYYAASSKLSDAQGCADAADAACDAAFMEYKSAWAAGQAEHGAAWDALERKLQRQNWEKKNK